MKSFLQFFNDEYLVLESISYIDKTLYKRLINEDSELIPSQEQVKQAETELQGDWLDPDEEIELIRKYKADPNDIEGLDARNKVIENKLKYIYAMAHAFVNRGELRPQNFKDAVNEAVIKLTEAIDKFDENKSAGGFNAYARFYIEAGLKNPFNYKRSKDVTSGKAGAVQSMDDQISGDRGEWADKDQTIADKVADYSSVPGQEMNDTDEQLLFKEFMRNLPEKEAQAIKLYYGVDGQEPKTYLEIGDALGMTKMGARQLTERALSKLKEMAKEHGY